ncbi:hypothetical protein D3C80_2056670 [compost metagenome]
MGKALQYNVEAQGLGIMQRAAAPGRESIAIDPYQVNIATALGDTFIQELDTFVYHGQNTAVVNLLVADLALDDPQFFCNLTG